MSVSGSLIDTNVWVARTFEKHPHHAQASEVMATLSRDHPAVFCRSTQQSFLRVATTPAVLRQYGVGSFSNRDALEVLRQLLALPIVVYREEPDGVVPLWHQMASLTTSSPKVWMDAYLAAFAIVGKLRLVTIDRDFKSFTSSGLDLQLLATA